MPAAKARSKKNAAHTAYERALKLLYKTDYAKAQAALESLVQKYPDEKAILARAAILIRLCENKTRKSGKVGQDGTRLYDSGVFEHNRGHFKEAIGYFDEALKKVGNQAEKGAVYRAMAASFARTDTRDRALECLSKAIATDETHRYHAQHDPDFESLSSDEDFQELVTSDRSAE
jgi:tetratricopeptide (TPR) repeat protein